VANRLGGHAPTDRPDVWAVTLSNVDATLPRQVRLDPACEMADGANGFRMTAASLRAEQPLVLKAADNDRLRANRRRIIGWARCAQPGRSSMSFNRVVVVVLLAAAGIGSALACGTNFPWQLLDNRDETVSEPIVLSFPFEASRLVTTPGWSGNASTAEPEAVIAEREEARSGAWRTLVSSASACGGA
jgi:hypothetical protein